MTIPPLSVVLLTLSAVFVWVSRYCSARAAFRRDGPWYLGLATIAAIVAFLFWAWTR